MEAVFLSSRFRERELKELREALTIELTKRFNTRPLNLDDGRADERSPIERSLEELASAGMMVLLLGATCGLPDATGRSVTELEFEQAAKACLPIFAYRMVNTDEDDRARDFRARVESRVTVGVLTGSVTADAAQIVVDIYESLAREGSSGDSLGSSVVIGGNATVVGTVVAGRDVNRGPT